MVGFGIVNKVVNYMVELSGVKLGDLILYNYNDSEKMDYKLYVVDKVKVNKEVYKVK